MSVETKSFGSRLSSRPSGASQPEAPGAQIVPPSRPRTRRGRGGLLKVKFPKGAKNPDKARKGGTSEPVEETRRRGEEGAPKAPPGAEPESGSEGEVVHDKEKAKLEVLRTLSKLLRENQLLRQRMVQLRKAK